MPFSSRCLVLPMLFALSAIHVSSRTTLAAPAGYVESIIALDGPPVGLAFAPDGTLYALENAGYGNNEATLRVILADGSFGNSFPVMGDDAGNFFAGGMTYDPIGERLLITDNTVSLDGKIYAVHIGNGLQETIATGIKGVSGVAVRDSGEIFVTTSPFNEVGEVRLVNRTTGGTSFVLGDLGFGAGIAFDAAGDLLVQDAATSSPYLGRVQKLPVEESAGGLMFGAPSTLVENTQAAAGIVLDGEGDLFITGNGGLFALQGTPLDDVPFSSSGSEDQIATAVAFQAGAQPFAPFAGPSGGRLAFLADFGFVHQDSLVTIITPAAPEDSNSDGDVDADDLAVWTAHFGAPATRIQDGDADDDDDVDGHDFLRWQRALTAPSSPPVVGAAIPEPAHSALTLIAAAATVCYMTRAGRRVLKR